MQGVEMQSMVATKFHEAVLAGDTSTAVSLLPELTDDAENLHEAKFLLLCGHFKTLLESGETQMALRCLREQIQPLEGSRRGRGGQETLAHLAGLLLSSNHHPCPPKRPRADETPSKQIELLGSLQKLVSPDVLLPPARLEHLVEQALCAQIERCQYHNTRAVKLSLMEDYSSGPDSLPTKVAQELSNHTDEVWVVQFSPDGQWLVSASKDGSAFLWDVRGPTVVLHETLVAHGSPINIASFNASSDALLLGSGDGKLRFYSVSSGTKMLELQVGSATEGISAALWMGDLSRVVVTCGKELRVLDLADGGAVKDTIALPLHAYDAVLSEDGGTCVTVGQDRRLRFIRLRDHKTVCRGPEPAAVTCLSKSPDGRFLSSNLANGSIHVWPLGCLSVPDSVASDISLAGSTPDPMDVIPSQSLQILKGAQSSQAGRFVIRSAFGGANSAFVASGSESCLVHIWHRESSTLIASVEGHSATVNAVSWNPKDDHMMASASDDHRVVIWRSLGHGSV